MSSFSRVTMKKKISKKTKKKVFCFMTSAARHQCMFSVTSGARQQRSEVVNMHLLEHFQHS